MVSRWFLFIKHGVEGSFVTMSDGQCMKHFAIGILPGMWKSSVHVWSILPGGKGVGLCCHCLVSWN